ncbi:unnamed protein product [Heterobilharzia americana]|nr:unnamed protein product [Heterobilharzia americana]
MLMCLMLESDVKITINLGAPPVSRAKLQTNFKNTTVLNPDAPEFIPSQSIAKSEPTEFVKTSDNDIPVTSAQEDLNFCFSNESHPSRSNQSPYPQAPNDTRSSFSEFEKYSPSTHCRTRTSSTNSEDDLDDSMLSCLLVIAPNSSHDSVINSDHLTDEDSRKESPKPSQVSSAPKSLTDADSSVDKSIETIIDDLCKAIEESNIHSDSNFTEVSVSAESCKEVSVNGGDVVVACTDIPSTAYVPDTSSVVTCSNPSFVQFDTSISDISAASSLSIQPTVLYSESYIPYGHLSIPGLMSYAIMPTAAIHPPAGYILPTINRSPFLTPSAPLYYIPQMNPIPLVPQMNNTFSHISTSQPTSSSVNHDQKNPSFSNLRQDVKGRTVGFFPVSNDYEGNTTEFSTDAHGARSSTTKENDTLSKRKHVGFLLRPASAARSQLDVTWSGGMPTAQHPSHLLQQKGFTFHAYNQFRSKCLRDREAREKVNHRR